MFEAMKQPKEAILSRAIEEFSLRLGMGKDAML